jgi:YfiH family protein
MTFKTQEKVFCQKQVPLEGGTSFPVLTFAAWEDLPGIRHCFTTRAGGVSEGYLSSLNFRRGLYDPDENINENFRRTARFFDVAPDRIVCAQQTHTANVRIVTEADAGKGVTRDRDYTDVDGLITDVPGLVLYTSHADCVPIYFYDPVRRVIALAHSGWKGTVARIGQVTIRKMADIYGCRPEDIYAAIGPSICADCYEVSEDVADAMRACFNSHTIPRILARGKRPGKYQLDLWRACERILLESGIRQDHLTVTNLCTCENSESLFSHRATNGKRGNQGAFLMMV